MAKIKFTSKRGEKPSKTSTFWGKTKRFSDFYKGKSIMPATGNSSLGLYCTPKNICLRLKNCADHRAAVNWVKEHAQELWEKYPFTVKLKEEEKQS